MRSASIPVLLTFTLALAACGGPEASSPPVVALPAPAPSLVAAPSGTSVAAVPYDLPRASAWSAVDSIFAVDVDAEGHLSINGERIVPDDGLLPRVRAAVAERPGLRAVIRADRAVPYGRVISVLDQLKMAGVDKIAFSVQADGAGAPAGPPPPPPPAGPPGSAEPPLPDGASNGTPATVASGTSWSCPFPPEADKAKIDSAIVVISVAVAADGQVSKVQILSDPGHGFGEAARACAKGVKYKPAIDGHGHAIASTTPPIRVHFTR
ncbi:MAG: TonB family protein [Byssovorax sp.]